MSDGEVCDCEFDPYEDPADAGDESFHYKRTCESCGTMWWSLHCIHDGVQNPCPSCGHIYRGRPTPIETLIQPLEGVPCVTREDSGQALILEVSNQGPWFVRIHSYDESWTPEHPVLEALIGRRLRITIEVID